MSFGGRPRRFSAAQVARALRVSNGIIEHAAQVLGCHRDTVWRYCVRHPSLRRLQLALVAKEKGLERAPGGSGDGGADGGVRAPEVVADVPRGPVKRTVRLGYERW